ncbi:MAG: tetratricopeptide repeat protein [Candidatus Heimdallarchaeota archaeon]|nr:tetratricopeptide repeat protein [Candidatus Heimdallarchaeota archaeon]
MIPSHAYNLLIQSKFEEGERYLKLLDSILEDEDHIIRSEFLLNAGRINEAEFEMKKIKQVSDPRLELAYLVINIHLMFELKKYNQLELLKEAGFQAVDTLFAILSEEERNEAWVESTKVWIGFFYDYLSQYYSIIGNFSAAFSFGDLGLIIREKLDNKLHKAMSLNHLASIQMMRGDYSVAEQYYGLSLEIVKKYDVKPIRARILINVGITKYFVGKIDDAFYYLTEGYNCSIDRSDAIIARVLFYINLCLISMNQNDEVQANHEKMKTFDLSIPRIQLYYAMSQAMYHKNLKGFSNRSIAISELKDIVNNEIIDINISRLAMVNLSDLLLEEYSIYRSLEALNELKFLINTMYSIARKQNSSFLLLEVIIFQSQLALASGEIELMERLLDEAENMAIYNGFDRLFYKIERIREIVSSESSTWELLLNDNNISNNIKITEVLHYLKDIEPIIGKNG